MDLEKPDSSGESPAKFIEGMAEKLGAVARAATIWRTGGARWHNGYSGGKSPMGFSAAQPVAEKTRTGQAVVAGR